MIDYFDVERADALNPEIGCAEHRDPACLCDVDLSTHELIEITKIPSDLYQPTSDWNHVNTKRLMDAIEIMMMGVDHPRRVVEDTRRPELTDIDPTMIELVWNNHWRGVSKIAVAEMAKECGLDVSVHQVIYVADRLNLPWRNAASEKAENVRRNARYFYIKLREAGLGLAKAITATEAEYPGVSITKQCGCKWWSRHLEKQAAAA